MRNIIIIEDEPEHAILMQRNLKRLGYTGGILHRETGEQGLELIEKCILDKELPFVMLDLNLPGIQGKEVLIKIKEKNSKIPVVIFTTVESEKELNSVYKKGANLFIRKPASAENYENVMSLIRDLLEIALFP